MTILEAITSSPINVLFTIVIGIGLAYLYCRKPSNSSSSSSSSSTPSTATSTHHPFRTSANNATHRGAYRFETGVVDEELQRTIARIERQERDMIRQEQDEAYQQSLKADREKKLKREEEQRLREAKERAEREAKERRERLHQRLTKLKSEISEKLPDSKPLTSQDDIVKLVFKLPDGSRVKRDFARSDRVKYLHWFVFSLQNAPLQFRLTTNFPKRDLPGRPPLPEDFEETSDIDPSTSTEPNCELTLEEAGLTETQIIFVYDLEA